MAIQEEELRRKRPTSASGLTLGEGIAAPMEGSAAPPAPAAPAPAAPEQVEHHPAAGVAGLDPEFNRRLSALIAATGGRVSITSGFRTFAEQAGLYAAAVAKYGEAEAGNWAAPPGKSNHNHGLAADLNYGPPAQREANKQLVHQLAPLYGLVFPMKHEPWHIEPAGVRTHPDTPPEAYTAPGTKNRPPITDQHGLPVETMASIADAYLSDKGREVNFGRLAEAVEAAQAAKVAERGTPAPVEVQTAAGTPEAPQIPQIMAGSTGAQPEKAPAEAQPQAAQAGAPEQVGQGGDLEAWITEALRISGKPESWRDPIRRGVMRESGGNPRAVNDWDVNAQQGHPTQGLTQFRDDTFAAQHWPGYDDIWNPVHSILAMIRRTDLTYGGNIERVAGAAY